jgi:hypothetical protein
MILRSDITKMEDTLKEYQLYKKFLDKVTPQVCYKYLFFNLSWIYKIFKLILVTKRKKTSGKSKRIRFT